MPISSYPEIPESRRHIIKYRNDLIVITAALLIRVIFFQLQQTADPVFLVPIVDELTYLNDASTWAASGFSVTGLHLPFWQPPGYTMFLAVWMRIGGSPLTVILFQMLLGTASSWLIYRSVLRLAGPANQYPAMAAALAYSAFPAALFYETKLLKPALASFIMLLIVFLSLKPMRKSVGLLAGALGAWLVLVETYMVIVPLLALVSQRKHLGAAALILLGMITVIAPVAALNARNSGGLLPGSYNGPINLFVGNNPDWERTYNAKPGWEWDRVNQRSDDDGSSVRSPSRRGTLFFGDVTRFAADHPGRFLRGLVAKTLMVFSVQELPRDGAMFYHPLVELMSLTMNGALALVIMFAATRFRHPTVIALILFFMLLNAAFFPTTRYRLPMIPLALIAAAAAPMRGPPRMSRILPAAIALSAIGSWTAARVVDDGAWKAFTLNEAAWHAIERGDMATAAAISARALQAAETPGTLNTAGLLAYQERGDETDSVRMLKRAMEIEPAYPDSYFNLARIWERSGKKDDAYRMYDAFVQRTPIDRPTLTRNQIDSAMSALSYLAHRDAEDGRAADALARMSLMRSCMLATGATTNDTSSIDKQMADIAESMRP